LQERALLEVWRRKFNDQLSRKSVEIIDLKKKFFDLQIKLDNFQHDKEKITKDLKHNTDTISSLFIILSKMNDNKGIIAEKTAIFQSKNKTLRKQIKQLTSSKNDLEESVIRLTQNKKEIANRLEEIENFIQTEIKEIWGLKEKLDSAFEESSKPMPSTPVKIEGFFDEGKEKLTDNSNSKKSNSGFNGKIISMNEENHFVIVDIGKSSGLRLGDNINVYRNTERIASLEIIQIRKKIAAANLKKQWSNIRVGDIVR